MIIGTNIKKGSTLEWFMHILTLNLSYVEDKPVIIKSLKDHAYTYVKNTLKLQDCPSTLKNRYLPTFGYTVQEHIDLLCTTGLFYPSHFDNRAIYVLLDVESEQDIQFLRSKESTLINIYNNNQCIDPRFDLNIEFNGLKYLNISNYLTKYITCYES